MGANLSHPDSSLVAAALDIARDEYPDLDTGSYLRQVREFGQAFARMLGSRQEDREVLHLLNRFFFDVAGFSGNSADYYDPRNSYLNDVLDRRLGIPISLSVLYREVAAAVGVNLVGINLPGHFVLRHSQLGKSDLYIDVFHEGKWLDWEECALRAAAFDQSAMVTAALPSMTDAEILLRMLRNLKHIHSRHDLMRCLRVQERIVQLAAQDPSELRDLGVLYFTMQKPMLAMKTFEQLVARHPDFSEKESVQRYLERVRPDAILLN